MTIKEFYTKKAMEEFDEALYENAKHKARKVVFMILYIVFFALAVIFLIGTINDSEFSALFVLFLIGGCVFLILDIVNRRKVKNKYYIDNKYIEMYIKKDKIPMDCLNSEYDESIPNYKVSRRYSYKGLTIDYSEVDGSIRISSEGKINKPISFEDVFEYRLFDEGRIVCQCKKGDIESKREFKKNGFNCEELSLALYYLEDDKVISKEYTLLKGLDRDSRKYEEAISLLKVVFNQIDNHLLMKYEDRSKGAKEVEALKKEKTTFDKLEKLKKLYDDGIIDEATFEEKKKKFVDEL